jgi:hypothetical protein
MGHSKTEYELSEIFAILPISNREKESSNQRAAPMRDALNNAWIGVWQGVGFGAFSFMLWVGWRFLHSKVAHKLNPEHFFHELHEFFTK